MANNPPGSDVEFNEMAAHYASGYEVTRLSVGAGRIERARTEELLERHLPKPPAVILDVGGGPGAYACWLARKGFEVFLIDAMPLHVEAALRASQNQPDHPLNSAAVGDARKLDWPDQSADVVLLLGPLYHLTDRNDRVESLREARRVVRPEGLVIAVGISRFASTLDGLFTRLLDDPEFVRIVERDLREGQHRNPTGHPAYFTTAYFHQPDELEAEFRAAGLIHEETIAVESIAWLLPNLDDHWNDAARRERLLNAVRSVEREQSLMGASAHLFAVGRKQPPG